jgi:hypothetical protein
MTHESGNFCGLYSSGLNVVVEPESSTKKNHQVYHECPRFTESKQNFHCNLNPNESDLMIACGANG